MHLPVANHIRVCFIVVEMLVIYAGRDLGALNSIVNFVLDPLLSFKVKQSEIIE